jgi:hypothetical protein
MSEGRCFGPQPERKTLKPVPVAEPSHNQARMAHGEAGLRNCCQDKESVDFAFS